MLVQNISINNKYSHVVAITNDPAVSGHCHSAQYQEMKFPHILNLSVTIQHIQSIWSLRKTKISDIIQGPEFKYVLVS